MRRRMVLALAAMIFVASLLLATPRPTNALSAYVSKGKSDCASFELGITLTFNHDDTGDAEVRDHFLLEVYDADLGHRIANIRESITQEQSPFYWQTGRIPGATWQGDYRIEMWDTDDKGNKQRRIDHAYLQCSTQNMWRDFPVPITPEYKEYPEITCYSRTPLWTTNGAPEKGAVIVEYTWGPERPAEEFHLYTIPVEPGQTFDHREIDVPCGTYLRLYFQPDSTKILYYMPSQYWPHDVYGTYTSNHGLGPVYHTFFPLDGPVRGATATPTPQPGTAVP